MYDLIMKVYLGGFQNNKIIDCSFWKKNGKFVSISELFSHVDQEIY